MAWNSLTWPMMNDVIICGHKHSNVDNDNYVSCFGKSSHDRNEEWIQCPVLCEW